MVKLFSEKKQQATSKAAQEARAQARSNLFMNFTYLILFLSVLLWIWVVLKNPQTLPLQEIQVGGQFQHISQAEITQVLQPYTHAGFFSVNTRSMAQSLLALPWVEKVSIHRVWPHTLKVKIIEENAVAQWGNNMLLNTDGQLFSPPITTFPPNLPILEGDSQTTSQEVWQQFQQYQTLLNSAQLTIAQMQIQADGSVIILLKNGLKLSLGKQDIVGRLQRFISIYSDVFAAHIAAVISVDMRYPNGMAVLWKPNEQPPPPQPQIRQQDSQQSLTKVG